jgi:predicted enzyme related to lactoylglutathione lyase
MTTTVSPTWASVNIDCTDSAGLADFWAKVLGRPVSPGKTPGIMMVGEPDPGSLQMVFAQANEAGKGTGGFQPNLITDHHDEEAERLAGLGATVVSRASYPQLRLTQLADPEGNLFNLATWKSE